MFEQDTLFDIYSKDLKRKFKFEETKKNRRFRTKK